MSNQKRREIRRRFGTIIKYKIPFLKIVHIRGLGLMVCMGGWRIHIHLRSWKSRGPCFVLSINVMGTGFRKFRVFGADQNIFM